MSDVLEYFSVYDVKSERFSEVYPALTKADFFRKLCESAKGKDNLLVNYPRDYVLYHIGTFYKQTGEFESLSVKLSLGSVADYVQLPPSDESVLNRISLLEDSIAQLRSQLAKFLKSEVSDGK